MLTAKAAFVLSNSFSVRRTLEGIDKEIRDEAKNGKFHVKTSIEGPYMVTAVTKVLEGAGYFVTVTPNTNMKDKQWLQIAWGFLSKEEA